jgi:hypothetical protein
MGDGGINMSDEKEQGYDPHAGRKLPDPKSGDNLFDYGRNRGRQFVPTRSAPDIFGARKTDANNERVRQVERAKHAEFHRRRFGKAITEDQYPIDLQNKPEGV